MSVPNIVYIHSHDTGRYVQPYGHAIPTPHIQQLAEEGVLFRQAFCANPTCSPSRACLLTGQWAHSCGMTGLVNRGWTLPYPERLLTHTLQKAGYTTAMAGFQHVVADVNDGGFTRLLPQEAPDTQTEDRAVAFLAEDHQAPFYLDVGFSETHRQRRGFAPQPQDEAPTDPRYVRPSAPFPDTPETRQDMAEYIDAARTLDAKMGRVFAALQDNGLADNTLVLCTTDHGIAFPTMKCNLTDHGLGVMLVLRGPGGFSGGQVVDALVSQVDIYPTVCALAGITLPDHAQGTSLLPLVNGQAQEIRERNFRRSKLPHLLRTPALHPHAALQVHPPLRPAPIPSHAQLRRQPDQRLLHRPRLATTPPRARTALRLGLRPARNPQPGRRPQLPKSPSGATSTPRPMDAKHRRPLSPRTSRSTAHYCGSQRSRRPLSLGAASPGPRIFGHLSSVR